MVPATYQLPVAIVILLGGVVACFFGSPFLPHRAGLRGLHARSHGRQLGDGPQQLHPDADRRRRRRADWRGPLIAAYAVGVALVGAGLGAVAASLAFSISGKDPTVVAVALCAIAGAVGSTYPERYFSPIVGTAFGARLEMIVGAMAVIGLNRAATWLQPREVDRCWVIYPLDPAPDRRWLPVAWIVLSLVEAAVQLGWTGGEKGRIGRRKKRLPEA